MKILKIVTIQAIAITIHYVVFHFIYNVPLIVCGGIYIVYSTFFTIYGAGHIINWEKK